MSAPLSPPAVNPAPWLEVLSSKDFPAWLVDRGISLAVTTYQTGKLFLLGQGASGRLNVHERTFSRCQGLWSDGQTIWMSSAFQLWRFENVLAVEQTFEGHDRLYIPRAAHTTGALDVHDLAIDADGRVVFVNTKFNCLATLDPRQSFAPLWRPACVSKLVAEDRCHLNGLAMRDGRPRYVTLVAPSDVVDGWRDRRVDGGQVVDVQANRVLAEGLSMPHSPRFHRDRLWLLNSGQGEFGWLDTERGVFHPVAFCPGYPRGLTLVDRYAIVALSLARDEATFCDLPLEARLRDKGAAPRCGLLVIDLESGATLHWVRFEGLVRELYDVCVLPGVRRPMALGLQSDTIEHLLTAGPEQTL